MPRLIQIIVLALAFLVAACTQPGAPVGGGATQGPTQVPAAPVTADPYGY